MYNICSFFKFNKIEIEVEIETETKTTSLLYRSKLRFPFLWKYWLHRNAMFNVFKQR